jgi:hypothetical protein
VLGEVAVHPAGEIADGGAATEDEETAAVGLLARRLGVDAHQLEPLEQRPRDRPGDLDRRP